MRAILRKLLKQQDRVLRFQARLDFDFVALAFDFVAARL
jgi:hypothetical protein